MTIDELHDYCRYLFDENYEYGVPDKWSKGYEFALSLVMFKCHEGLTDEDRKAVADWREKTLEGHEMSRAIRYAECTPLRRDGGHILRDLPVLRIQASCAQSSTKGEMCGLTQVTID